MAWRGNTLSADDAKGACIDNLQALAMLWECLPDPSSSSGTAGPAPANNWPERLPTVREGAACCCAQKIAPPPTCCLPADICFVVLKISPA
jgi:hypothetical protein